MKIFLAKIQPMPDDLKLACLLAMVLLILGIVLVVKHYINLKRYKPGTGKLWLCPCDHSRPVHVGESFLNHNIPHKFFRVLKRVEIREPFKKTTGFTQVEYWD